MPIEIRHVSATESDVLRLCANVEVAAFANSHVNPVVFPGPFPADSSEQRAKDLSSQLSDSSAHLLVAFDTEQAEGEQIAGWSKWEVYRDGLPKPKPRTWGPGINVDAANLMFGSIDEMRDRNMTGKPCVCELDPSFRLFCPASSRLADEPTRSQPLGHPSEAPGTWNRRSVDVMGHAGGGAPGDPSVFGVF